MTYPITQLLMKGQVKLNGRIKMKAAFIGIIYIQFDYTLKGQYDLNKNMLVTRIYGSIFDSFLFCDVLPVVSILSNFLKQDRAENGPFSEKD